MAKEKTFNFWHGKLGKTPAMMLNREGNVDTLMQNASYMSPILLSSEMKAQIQGQLKAEKKRIARKEKWKDWFVLAIVQMTKTVCAQIVFLEDLQKQKRKCPVRLNSYLKKYLKKRQKEDSRDQIVSVLVNRYEIMRKGDGYAWKTNQSEHVSLFTERKEETKKVIEKELATIERRVCKQCHKLFHTMKRCCGSVYYCNKECQIEHWPIHKLECSRKSTKSQ